MDTRVCRCGWSRRCTEHAHTSVQMPLDADGVESALSGRRRCTEWERKVHCVAAGVDETLSGSGRGTEWPLECKVHWGWETQLEWKTQRC